MIVLYIIYVFIVFTWISSLKNRLYELYEKDKKESKDVGVLVSCATMGFLDIMEFLIIIGILYAIGK